MPGILYFTDKFGVSQGYEPAFTKLVNKCGIPRHKISTTHIYNIVESPLYKKGNESVWRFAPDKLDRIRAAFDQRVRAINPDIIVVSCPAILGVLANGDSRLATLEKMRGGVYYVGTIPCIVAYPITAIHQRIDARLVENEDGETDTQQPYRVPQGGTILRWDWQKVGRFYAGKPRRIPEFRYSICRTLEDLFSARDYLRDCILLSSDIETGNHPAQITCVGYTGLQPNGAVHSFVVPLYDAFAEGGTFWDSLDDHAIAWSVIREINDLSAAKIFQNGAYDCSYFIRDRAPVKNFFWDTMIMWWSLYMELPKSLDFISSVLLDNYQYWKDDIKGEEQGDVGTREPSMERYWRYNALDSYNTMFNFLMLIQLFAKDKGMQWNYNDAMRRMFSALGMSMRGVRADFDRREYHRKNLEEQRDREVARFRWLLGEPDFNINSPHQKASLLYDLFGLPERTARGRFVNQKEPKKGLNAPSAGKIPLKMAKTEHPVYKHVIEVLEAAMEPDKQLSNVFGKKDPETGKISGGLFMPTGRMRTSFSAVGTETTRLSSKKSAFWDGGNVQNIRGDYRDWIIPDKDHIFLDVDYSQSDDVFIAYESQDPDKIDVILKGLDAHAVNGELFFGKTYDWIVQGKLEKRREVVHPIEGIRQITKRVGHGANFQMAGMTLYVTMGRESVVAAALLLGYNDAGSWDQDRLVQLCQVLMGMYRNKYKRLTKNEWYMEIFKELMAGNSITNAYGITRRFLGDPKDNATQREATAFIGQSGTSGNMNRVMAEIDQGYIPPRFRDADNPAAGDEPMKMTWDSHGFAFHLQVHDNFVAQLNTKHKRFTEAAHNLLQVMERPTIIKGRYVRVAAEAELGLRWGKKMTPWDGKPQSFESAVNTLMSTGR